MLKNRLKGFIDKSNESPDVVIFLSLFVIGFMVQIGGRLLFSVPAIIVSLILILLLIGYAWVVKAMAYAKLSHEKASDNFYYLGFLFTVVTLSIALYKFGTTEASDGDLLKNVISDLGVGLSTTIVGLFLRMLFVLMRHTPEEIEDRVIQHLQERAHDIEKKMLTTMNVLDKLDVRTNQILIETGLVIEKSVSIFPELVDKVHGSVLEEVDGLTKSYAESLRSQIDHTKLLVSSSSELSQASNAVVENLNSISFPSDLLIEKVEQSASVLSKSAESIENTFQEILGGYKDVHAKIISNLEEVKVPYNIDEKFFEPAVINLNTNIDEFGNSLKEIVKKIDSELIPINQQVHGLAGQVTQLQSQLSNLNKNDFEKD
jgi:hypothetical protein